MTSGKAPAQGKEKKGSEQVVQKQNSKNGNFKILNVSFPRTQPLRPL